MNHAREMWDCYCRSVDAGNEKFARLYLTRFFQLCEVILEARCPQVRT